MVDSFSFKFNKYSYDTQIKQHLTRKDLKFFKGLNELVQLAIILPFQLPVAKTDTFSRKIKDSDRDRILFSFSDITSKTPIYSGEYREISHKKHFERPSSVTRVEFNVFKEKLDSFDDQIASHIFDTCLDHLNTLILAYKIKYGDTSVYQLTKEMLLTPFITISWKNVSDFHEKESTLLGINIPKVYHKESISEYETYLLEEFASRVVEKGGNPFLNIEDFSFESKRQLDTGFYTNAVVLAQTSIETFTYQIIKLLKTDQLDYRTLNFNQMKRKANGISGLLEEILINELSRRWLRTDINNPLGVWYRRTYVLRNNIIHSGYIPNFIEAQDAVDAAVQLRYQILLLFNDKKERYPSIQKYYDIPVR